jgi:hypothetical protein
VLLHGVDSFRRDPESHPGLVLVPQEWPDRGACIHNRKALRAVRSAVPAGRDRLAFGIELRQADKAIEYGIDLAFSEEFKAALGTVAQADIVALHWAHVVSSGGG